MTVPSGKLFVLSGPSGAGKTSICKSLAGDLGLYYSISHTTRNKRDGEVHGRDYFFISKDEFQEKKLAGEFLESAEVHGNSYGTCKLIIDQHLVQGQSVILDLDFQGALSLKGEHVCLIFLKPPSLDVLKERLLGRGKDSSEVIEKRLAVAQHEMSFQDSYDYVVINDDLQKATQEVKKIIESHLE